MFGDPRILFSVQGFDFCGRHFEFLASSTSQLHEKSAWFFAPIPGEISLQNVRDFMGNFDRIDNTAKRLARMGQFFSSSRYSKKVPTRQIIQVPDVQKTDAIGDKNIFTDGIGMMSMDFAKELAREMSEQKEDTEFGSPSAFQIRSEVGRVQSINGT